MSLISLRTIRQCSLRSGFSADLGKFEFKPVEFIGISFNLLDFTVLYNTVKTPVPDYSMSMTNFTAGFDYGMSVGVKYYF